METFSALLAICAGNSPVLVNSPHKGQWRGALMFSLISASMNGWVNNREAGDLRCNRAHYEVNVMLNVKLWSPLCNSSAYAWKLPQPHVKPLISRFSSIEIIISILGTRQSYDRFPLQWKFICLKMSFRDWIVVQGISSYCIELYHWP